jgi:TolB-like protein
VIAGLVAVQFANSLLDNNKRSIAVMPFEYKLTKPQLTGFNDTGLPDVIANLKRGDFLDVISYHTVPGYPGQSVAPPELAEKLGVRFTTTGDLEVEYGYVLAKVTVTDARTGRQTRTMHRVLLQEGWEGALATQISMGIKTMVAELGNDTRQ